MTSVDHATTHSAGATLSSFYQDLRYATRRLRHHWGFTVLAVVTLALGIGATTAVFSVVNGVLLRPLPYPQSDQLVAMAEANPKGGEMRFASGNFADVRAQSHSFDGVAAYANDVSTVLGGAQPLRASVTYVSDDFFPVFRVQPLIGRQFTQNEMSKGGPHAAVVSYGFWRDQLGGADITQ